MTSHAFYIVVGLLVFFLAAILQPTRARCPSGWWLDEGVRADGEYECAPLPSPRWVRGSRGGWVDESPEADGAIESHVYCTGGTRPVVVNGVAVSCQRGGWR